MIYMIHMNHIIHMIHMMHMNQRIHMLHMNPMSHIIHMTHINRMIHMTHMIHEIDPKTVQQRPSTIVVPISSWVGPLKRPGELLDR